MQTTGCPASPVEGTGHSFLGRKAGLLRRAEIGENLWGRPEIVEKSWIIPEVGPRPLFLLVYKQET